MRYESIALALAAATSSLAATPQGFTPASNAPLWVGYNGMEATDGRQIAKEVSTRPPQLGTTQRIPGTSFAVMMIDIDIPTNSPPQTNMLLHWMQTGLTQSQTSTMMNTSAGAMTVFLMQMPGAVQAAAPYFGPNPPARTPLAHRYTQLVVDTSAASQTSMDVLLRAAQTRLGFNAEQVLAEAQLQDKVVAGNFFVVTNPGPAQDNAAPGLGAGSNSTLGGGGGTVGGGEGQPGQPGEAPPSRAAASTVKAGSLLAAVAAINVALFYM